MRRGAPGADRLFAAGSAGELGVLLESAGGRSREVVAQPLPVSRAACGRSHLQVLAGFQIRAAEARGPFPLNPPRRSVRWQ